METPEEQSTMDAQDYTYIVKGKRTKRQKLHSPVPLGIPAGEITPVIDGVARSNTSSCPTSSDEFRDSTEEEEDMANCLILLAQGQRFGDPVKQAVGENRNDDVVHPQEEQKFNSRKFLEKAGYYVYQCKTCNKTFPSFQALGGHRASHKKPNISNNSNKSTAVVEEKINKQLLYEEDEDEARFKKFSSLSLQLSSQKIGNSFLGNVQQNRQMAKVHECSICGAEFTSGQALGGHMRRHRPIQVGTGTPLALTAVSLEASEEPPMTSNLLSLDLDLNLPAPEDEMLIPFDSTGQQHQHQHKQQQQQQQQHQNHLVFSAPALVDCHY